MTLPILLAELEKLHAEIDGAVDLVDEAAKKAQEKIYQAIILSVQRFQIEDGRFIATQDFSSRILALEKKMKEVIGDIYAPSVSEYLTSYRTVEDTTVALQKSYNQIEVDTESLSPIRKAMYGQARHYLVAGLAEAYIQPAKYLLMQQVTGGITIKDSLEVLSNWNEGKAAGEVKKIPTLQRYATQISRDSIYQYYGGINDKIAVDHDLDHFIYVGNIVEDSRPLCKHLVGLRRKIKLEEMPKLIKKYPQGLYPDTTKENFIRVRAGFSCRHSCFPVKGNSE